MVGMGFVGYWPTGSKRYQIPRTLLTPKSAVRLGIYIFLFFEFLTDHVTWGIPLAYVSLFNLEYFSHRSCDLEDSSSLYNLVAVHCFLSPLVNS